MPGFPRHTQNLGASRGKAGSRSSRAASANLENFWLKDGSLEDSANLLDLNPDCPASLDILKVSMLPAVKLAAAVRVRPALDPGVLALEITEDLEGALAQFAQIATDLKR